MQRRLFLLAPLALALAGCGTFNQNVSSEPPVIVFFSGDSAALEEPALALVRGAAATAARYPNAPVRVLGFAGPTGGRPYNVALSRARAEQISTHLTEAGVPASRIRVVARGPVEFEFAEMESRRVEIRFGE